MLKLNEAQWDHLERRQSMFEKSHQENIDKLLSEAKPGMLSDRLAWRAYDLMLGDLRCFHIGAFLSAESGDTSLERWQEIYQSRVLERRPAHSTSNGHRMEHEARLEVYKNMLELIQELISLENEQ